MSNKAWVGDQGTLVTRLLLTVPLAESGPPAVKARAFISGGAALPLVSLGCLLATGGLCLDAPLGPDLREGQSCLQTQGYCWSPGHHGGVLAGEGVFQVFRPLFPQADCGSRGPTRFCCSVERCKGAGRQSKHTNNRKKNHHMNNNPPSLGDSRDSYLDAPLS